MSSGATTTRRAHAVDESDATESGGEGEDHLRDHLEGEPQGRDGINLLDIPKLIDNPVNPTEG